MPTVSPLPTTTSTFSTARTVPRRVANSTVRSRMSSRGMAVIGSPPPLRVDDVTKPVAEKVEAEPRQHRRGAGEERDPPLARDDESRAFGHHDSPLGHWRAHAEANEGKAGGVEDGVAHGERYLHHHDRQDVWQDMREKDS